MTRGTAKSITHSPEDPDAPPPSDPSVDESATEESAAYTDAGAVSGAAALIAPGAQAFSEGEGFMIVADDAALASPVFSPVLERLRPADVAMANLLIRKVWGIPLSLGERKFRLSFRGYERQGQAASGGNGVELETSGVSCRFWMAASLIGEAVSPWVDSADFVELPTALQLGVMEAVLGHHLDTLGRMFRMPIALTRIGLPAAAEAVQPCWVFDLREQGAEAASFTVRLAASSPGLMRLEDVILDSPDDRRRRHLARLPVPLDLEAARMVVSVEEMRALEPGDVLCPGFERSGGCSYLRVAGGHRIKVQLDGDRAVVEGAWMKDEAVEDVENVEETFSVDEVQIGLSFELGRVQVTLKELAAMQPGYVLLLPGVGMSDVTIRANGRRVGRGELVQVGETLGVRIVELSAHGA